MKILLIRPPHRIWPFLNGFDNFLPPQSLACLGAILKKNNYDVKIIDCMGEKIGWKTLRKKIDEEEPDIVGAGSSQSLHSAESLKLFNLVKDINENIFTVAGGAHFSHFIEDTLSNHPVDFIVRGEGEFTFLELIREMENGYNFENVKGIAFEKNGKITRTDYRPLIEDLDELPMPAYDLLPMKKYGNAPLYPWEATIHHSRGCIEDCDFCICWKHMSERNPQERNRCSPKWRTKSVERALDELELLQEKYGKKNFLFVDDAWNVSPGWNEDFAEGVSERNLDINWSAFMKSDFLLRDEERGILNKLVRSGLSHVCLGVERASDSELQKLGKRYSYKFAEKSFEILKEKYPQVFRHATFIVGLREDARDKMLKQLRLAKKMDIDFPSFQPLTPLPGTVTWKKAKEEGWFDEVNFDEFDWLTPVMGTNYMSQDEVEDLLIWMKKNYLDLKKILNGLLGKKYRRNMYLWFILVSSKIFLEFTLEKLSNKNTEEFRKKLSSLKKPAWYDK